MAGVKRFDDVVKCESERFEDFFCMREDDWRKLYEACLEK